MSNSWFQFKQFIIQQDRCAMKVTTDSCLFGAWVAEKIRSSAAGLSGKTKPGKILDIGTGTGLLSLMISQKNESPVDAIEIDNDAYEQASSNVSNSPWAGRINIIHGDARKVMFPGKYDVILSNPPFYEKELKGADATKNLAHHNEGLLFPELLALIKNNLSPGGSFYLLLPYKKTDAIKKLLVENGLTLQHTCFVRQTVDHDYFRIMLAGKLTGDQQPEINIDEISIKDKEDQYTPAFINLLRDYYLRLDQ